MKELIVIYPDQVGSMIYSDDFEISLETMQGFVGGPIETIPAFRAGYVLIVNEEHKILGNLKINMRATRILSPDIKDALFGTALLMKVDGEDLVVLDREETAEWLKMLQ